MPYRFGPASSQWPNRHPLGAIGKGSRKARPRPGKIVRMAARRGCRPRHSSLRSECQAVPATAVQTPTVRKHAPHQARLACPSVQQAARADQSVRAASRRLDSYTAKPYMPPWMSSTVPRRTRPTAPNTACRSPSAPSCSRTVSVAVVDNRRDYGEIRINAFGPVNNRLFVCTYTMRGETHRLISVRKASRQEQNTWLR